MNKLFVVALSLLLYFIPVQAALEFEGFLETWKQDSQATLDNLRFRSNTVVNIAFGDFNFTLGRFGAVAKVGGLQISLNDLKDFISFIHSKGGKVKLSLGGVSHPLSQTLRTRIDADDLAKTLSRVISELNLDGVDFDIEDSVNSPSYYHEFPQYVVLMIQELRQHSPNALITLTVPGGGWFEPWNVIIPGVKNIVSSITFMEYNIWVNPARNYVQQIVWDLGYYQTLWGLSFRQMHLGLMPGRDNLGHNLSLQDTRYLAEKAVKLGLSGVMIWSLNRDYEGQDGNLSGAYGIEIQHAIR